MITMLNTFGAISRPPSYLVLLLMVQQHLFCDLTCDFESSVGCAISVLPENCRACYDGDYPPSAPTGRPVTIFPTSAPTKKPSTISPTSAPTKRAATFSPTSSPTKGIHETQLPVYHHDSAYSPTLEITPSPSAVSCTACDSAGAVLTAADWRTVVDSGFELVCDPNCYVSPTPDGCGVYGLDVGCRAVRVDYGSDGNGTNPNPIVSCSAEEEDRCADISPAQQEALDSYDNGGKIIVCDPTCVDHPVHCNCESKLLCAVLMYNHELGVTHCGLPRYVNSYLQKNSSTASISHQSPSLS